MRVTLGSVQLSMLPAAIGVCASDLPQIAAYVNRAQEILINCGGETGFWGGWQKIVFPLTPCFPYFTLPREFSRVINMDVCRFPIRIQNEFYEFLEGGIGLQSRNDLLALNNAQNWCGASALQGFERGVWPSFRDLAPANQKLRVYITDARDVSRRILVGPAWDQNGNQIYTTDGNNQVNGFYLSFDQPFVTSDFIVSRFDGIQKDATFGAVILKQVDADTSVEVTLSRYAPDETIPAYRRYFVKQLPCGCDTSCTQSPCVEPVTPPVATVTALVKLQFVPASLATDFLIIGNIPALIEEVKALRYADMDAATAPALEQKSHRRAIKMLQDEMRTYLGELQPAVNFAPFGTARITRPLSAIRYG